MEMTGQSLAVFWTEIEKNLNENPAPFEDFDVVYQFDLSGEESGTYQLILDGGKASVEEGAVHEAKCTLKMGVENFKKLVLGNLNSTAAYMTGKLKVEGSLGLALKLESLLKKYHFE